ncbi:MAG: cytochrome P450 [Actinomycetota bacterium]|nr:cytochrome P450 [Actinomycetota bacterium]
MTDLALRLLRDGYHAVSKDRRARAGGPTYVSRLLGRRTVVLGDAAGAALFYDEAVVRRKGAVPPPLSWLLFGRGAVHGLDAGPHRDRKLMFLELLSPERLTPLVDGVTARLGATMRSWTGRDVVLFDELVRAYGGAVLEWAGVPVDGPGSDRISRRLASIVDGFGFGGAAYARAWRDRLWADRWATGLVDDVRAGVLTPPAGSALAMVAATPALSSRTAGVELLNLLRPTVAVAWLGTFAGQALHQAPEWRSRMAPDGAVRERYAFAQEVRRTTPFAPALAGLVLRPTTHAGVPIRRGDRLLLDVIGIHRDPRHWPEPTAFRPERFLDDHEYGGRVADAFELVPQGGGHPSGHRCPGESAALRLLMATAQCLATVHYETAEPTHVDLSRIPTLPTHGLRLTDVRVAAGLG